MDISSKANGIAGRLSNFTTRYFVFDGIQCNSMEGLLQSFKFENIESQKATCLLVGGAAKKKGRGRNNYWQSKQKLWWNGKSYLRKSKDYQILLNRAYNSMYSQSEQLRNDLKNSQNAIFSHNMGSNNEKETVLTEREFCSRLQHLKDKGLLPEN